jgi:hypothetical protein
MGAAGGRDAGICLARGVALEWRQCSPIRRLPAREQAPQGAHAMLNAEIQSVVEQLIPLLCQFALSEAGIAVGGAHAKGTDDAASDLDLYVFASDVLTSAERAQRARDFSPEVAKLVSWGDEEPFTQGGTDFTYRAHKVECWLRNSELIESTLAECREGIVRRDFVTWTTTGFYNHCCLSDLKAMIPVSDPAGLLAGWKLEIAVYPPKLRAAIVRGHLSAARFWPHNFHYDSAIERQDVIYTTGIVQQVVHNLIQVLFAANSTYFPGDKKLAEALGHLACTPARFAERVNALLFPAERVSVALLKRQQAELQRLLREVEDLVAERLGVEQR